MKATLRGILFIGFLLMLAGPVVTQEKPVINTDVLRERVQQLELMNVEGKSASVQSIHKRALLAAYEALQHALSQEIEDVRKIRLTVDDSTGMQQEVDDELKKLGQEEKEIALKVRALKNPELAIGTRDSSSNSSTTPGGGPSSAPLSAPASVPIPATENITANRVTENASAVVTAPQRDFTVTPGSASLSTATGTVAPSQASTSLNADLNNRVKEATRAKIQQRSASNQTEVPSASANSTSLVDTSSAGDLVNLGLNLAGLTGASKDGVNKADALSVTTSAYALYSAFQGVDPLNPGFYNRNSGWRRLSFTLGYEDEKNDNGVVTPAAKIFGLKYLIFDKRDPARSRHKSDYDLIARNLERASSAFGKLDDKVKYYFFTNKTVREKLILPQFKVFLEAKKAAATLTPNPRDPNQVLRIDNLLQRLNDGSVFIVDSKGVAPSADLADARIPDLTPSQSWKAEELAYFVQFTNDYLVSDYRNKLKEAVGQKVLDELDAFIDKQLTDTKAYEDLSDSTREALERIRRAPQFSLYFLTKQRPQGSDDDYTGEAIFDYGVANRINLTLNGNYLYKNSRIIGGDTRSGKLAAQLRFQLTPEKLTGRNPFFFFLSGDAERHSGKKSTYHMQAKVTIPILNGLDLPFSVTYGNQPDLNKEKTVKGQFGFTLDFARILQALTPK
jgi:hypothetical protein